MLNQEQSLNFKPATAINQANEMCKQAVKVLCMLPSYGIYNESGMIELRKAVCEWLDVKISDEQASDAKGFEQFVAPYLSKLE